MDKWEKFNIDSLLKAEAEQIRQSLEKKGRSVTMRYNPRTAGWDIYQQPKRRR